MSGRQPNPLHQAALSAAKTKEKPKGDGTDTALAARRRRANTILTSGDEDSPTTSILGG